MFLLMLILNADHGKPKQAKYAHWLELSRAHRLAQASIG